MEMPFDVHKEAVEIIPKRYSSLVLIALIIILLVGFLMNRL
jgi:hypothetical protein